MGTGHIPRVLLVTAFRWITSVRAALEFSQNGFDVHVVSPSWGDFAGQPYVSNFWRLGILRPENSIRAAIVNSRPDLIVALDDCARGHLNTIHQSVRTDKITRTLIAKSLGDPRHFETLYNRAGVSNLALKLGLRVPATISVLELDELATASRRIGFPSVLKSDGSWGGQGVETVKDEHELVHGFNRLRSAPSLRRAIWRILRRSDFSLLRPSLAGSRQRLSLQEFVAGRPANASVACWQGEVLATVTVEVIKSRGSTGPSTVVRLLEHPDITDTVAALVRQLGLSGLCGFDFILTRDNRAMFLEINPRATPTFHLIGSGDVNMIALLKEKLTGATTHQQKNQAKLDTIALFPQEIMRDPKSPYLAAGFHDIPLCSPEFVALSYKLVGRRSNPWTCETTDETVSETQAQNHVV